MRAIFLAACIALVSPVYAQLFEHHYGTNTGSEQSQWGMYTTVTPPAPPVGYVISGLSPVGNPQVNWFSVSRADNFGNVPIAPYFNRMCRVSQQGIIRSVNDAKVIELPNGLGFAVAGSCIQQNTGQEFVYYARLSPNGNPLNPVFYYRTASDMRYRLHSVKLAPGGNFVYLAGEASGPVSVRFFVLKLNINGPLVWGNTYTSLDGINYIERAFDVLENPVAAANFVAVVGTSTDPTSQPANTDGFFLRLNPGTGAPAPGAFGPMYLYGNNYSYDHFYSIDNSTDPAPPFPLAPNGYVIGGYTSLNAGPGNFDAWVVRIDNTPTLGWTTRIDYVNAGNTTSNECRDVVEIRNNMTGAYEYLAGGNTVNGILGGPDMELDKLNAAGGVIWQNTYGSPGPQRLSVIDENPANNDIALFGETNPGLVGLTDLCIFNTDMTGKTACDYLPGYIPEKPGPQQNGEKEFQIKEPFMQTQGEMLCSLYFDRGKCMIPVGPVIVPKSVDAPQIEMNITATGESGITISVTGFENAPAELTVMDITGRIIYQQNVTLQTETTYLPVDLSGQVSNGIYMITIRQGAVTETRKVLVTR